MVDFSALFKKKEDSREHYFGLFLRGDSAVGFLFEIKDGAVSLIAKEACKYTNGWEGILDDIDELLAVLENETQLHIDDCIFFVYSYFIDQATQEIKEPYKGVIKNISKELELKPMGYIECHEAVKNILEEKEASPLNAVLVELDHNHLSYYVYKGGKMVHSDQTPRTDSVIDDISELFSKNKDHFLLPSKVILYGSSSLEKEAQEMKDMSWEKDLFIQSPRVSVMKNEDVLAGLSNTFMEQIEKNLGADDMVADQAAATMTPAEEVAPAPTPREEAAKKEVPVPSSRVDRADDDGIPDEAEHVGFMIGADIADDPQTRPPMQTSGIHLGAEVQSLTDKLPKFPKLPALPAITLPNLSFGSGSGAAKTAFAVASVILIIGAVGGAEYLFHKAKIEIDLPSDKISDAFSLKSPLSGGGDGSFTVEKKTISQDMKDSTATSGQRDVGEKAKGNVTIHNFSDSPLHLNSGIALSIDNLQYVLDSDVTVASASEKVVNGVVKEPGKQNASVTAKEIGPEYNIAKDKRLSISGLSASNYFGLVTSDFSGGSKKQLKTVAKKDLDTLQKRILDKEKSEALDEIKSHLGPDESTIPDLTDVKISKSSFSGEVGQEANDVSVNASVSIEYYVFNEGDLKKEVASRLKKNVPGGFEIDKNKLAYKVNNSQKKADEVDVNVKGEATVVKTIDKKKVLSRITGKDIDETRKILKEEFSAEDVIVKDNASPVFFMTSRLPFSTNNIEVSLKSE